MDKQMRMGGIGEAKEPDNTVHEICEKVRGEVEQRSGNSFREFTPVLFKTQLVNGMNYYVKVRVNQDDYVHIRAHKSFGGDITFCSHEENKSFDEDVIFFERREGNE